MAGDGAGAHTGARVGEVALVMATLDRMKAIGQSEISNEGPDAMKLGLSNFEPVATNEVIEQEVLDLGDAEQLTPPMIESDQELASLIRQVGVTSITDIDQLIGELEEARDYLKSEEERIRAETARYTALTQAASASVKIIFDAVRDWRKTGHSDRNQSRTSALEITNVEQLDEC
jgi:hypothetical protein